MDMNLFLSMIEKLGPAAMSMWGGSKATGTLEDAVRSTDAARREAGGNATKLLTDIMGDQTGLQQWAYGQGTGLNKYAFDETNNLNKWAFQNAVDAKNTGIGNARAALNEGLTGALGYLNPYVDIGNKALGGLGASVAKYPGGVGKSFSERETSFPTVQKLSYKDFSSLTPPPSPTSFQGAGGAGLAAPPTVDMNKFLISSGSLNNDAEAAIEEAMGAGALGEGAGSSTAQKVAKGATVGSLIGVAANAVRGPAAVVMGQALSKIGLAALGAPVVGALIGAGIMGVQALVGHFTKLGRDKESATRGIDALTKINQTDWLPKVKAGKMTEDQYHLVLQAAFNDWAKLLPDDVHDRSINSQLYWWNKGLSDNGFKFQLEMPGHEANQNAGSKGFDQKGNPN